MGFFDFFKRDGKRSPGMSWLRRRSYQGADSGRLESSWSRSPTSADAEVYKGVRALRARSREERRNNPVITRYMALLGSNVVGPRGIVMQSQGKSTKTKPDIEGNDAIEKWWREWGKTCDVTRRLSWVQMQTQIIQGMAEDGEVFVEKVPGLDGLKLLLIDPELISIDHHAELNGGGYIRMGIEYTTDGAPSAYHVRKKQAANSVISDGYSFGQGDYRRVPADQMLHLFVPDRVGQSRGVPWTASVLWRLKMHAGYTDAAVTAARVGAAKMGFFTAADGGAYTGSDTSADGATLIDAAEPGAFEMLPEGWDFKSFDPDYPHAQFASFDKSMHRSHASGLNVAYHALASDLEGVSFSSIRAGVLEDREAWKGKQEMLIEKFCQPVFESALEIGLALGRVLNGTVRLPSSAFEKFKTPLWQGRRWAWVDPLKDMTTAKMSYEMGATSLSAIIRDLGRDPEDVWRERQRENELMKQYGVTPNETFDAIGNMKDEE
mgnify:CR=1 FL=1